MEPLLTFTVTDPAFRELRNAYDQAFRRFILAMNAHGNVEQAEIEYREARNELAEFLISRRSEHVESACCAA